MAEKKYYWLKLHRDFFKRHDIQIVEDMENGKDYILFYLKLLVESIDHDGKLRFSDAIPYNDKMLSTVTHTNIDIVRSAMKIFEELQMITILDDETIFMEEVTKLIGQSSTDSEQERESHRLRQQRYRERQKLLSMSCDDNVTVICDGEIEKDIEIDKEKEIDKELDTEKKSTPKKHKFGEFKHVLLTDDEYDKLATDLGVEIRNDAIRFLDEYIEEKGYKSKSHNLAIRRWVVDAVRKEKLNRQSEKIHQSYYKKDAKSIDWSKV